MTSTTTTTPPKALTVLVVGASGYLGSAICTAFLRAGTPSRTFRVHGLVRRAAAALPLAKNEVIPILGRLPDRQSLVTSVLSYANTWDVIVTCTEPSRSDTAHWDDLLFLVQGLSAASAAHGVRPFVLWSSGCKDYGTTGLHGADGLGPHVETTPLDTHPLIAGRTDAALGALDRAAAAGSTFDASVVRATPLFGYTSSYYGAGFDYVSAVAQTAKEKILVFTPPAGTILHGIHVDDAADGYVALALTALSTAVREDGKTGRQAVSGEVFNISGRRYETLEEVGTALAREYGFDGVRFGVSDTELPASVSAHALTLLLVWGWSQWVGSDKIRRVTGWRDWRPLLAENLAVYRRAYEAAAASDGSRTDDNVERIKKRMAGAW